MTGADAAIVSTIVSVIFKNVGDKLVPELIKKYSSIVGVKKDLQELQVKVGEINSVLEGAGDRAMRGHASFNWLKQLKDVAYDVDDVVDEFQLKAERHDAFGDGGIMSKYRFQFKMANKIKEINKRLDAIVKQRADVNTIANNLSVCHSAQHISNTNEDRTTWPNVDVEKVLGRDKEKHQIISKLIETNDQQGIKIVSIIGLGGTGKTTLAKLVFNDGDIEKHYDVRLWVHVPQKIDNNQLVKKLFEAIPNKDHRRYDLQDMINKVTKELTGKRFLVVLDDVWPECLKKWEDLMVFLKIGAPGSGILLTTRSREVALTVDSTHKFDLPFLSPDYSWELFEKSLVMPPKGLDIEFVDVGKDIVKKCGGVPLAIKALAGVLRGKKLRGEWQTMRDSNLLDVEGEEHLVYACLSLSYIDLPSHLKQCFTICSLFPKGHKIDKEQLIDLWIAHDMITLRPGVDYLDDIGDEYLNSLVQRSFLQVENGYDGRVICSMHDLVHDLARSILDDKISLDVPKDSTSCTKSYRYFSLTGQAQNLPPKNLFQKAHSIYVDNCDGTIIGALKKARHLRSILMGLGTTYMQAIPIDILQVKNLKYLVISGLQCEALPESISNIWSLQALHVTYSNLLKLPKSIGKLHKLRKLNLFQCTELECLPDSIGDCQMISSIDLCKCENLTVLPESIGRIEKLRVLRLGETKIERLPSGITALRNLECLDLQGCVNLRGMPVGIGQLSRPLSKLDLFVVGEGDKFAAISELGNVGRNSEDLTISGIECVMEPDDAHKACLKQKANLQRLNLQWSTHVGGEESTKLLAVLDGLEPPPGIKDLKIVRYSGRECARWMQNHVGGGVQGLPYFPFFRVLELFDFPNLKHLDGLAELPCLEELELKYLPSLESISGGPFPSLVKLVMWGLHRLGEVWMVAEKSMPDGEEGRGCSNCTPHLVQVLRVGNCVSNLDISSCPKLVVKPYLPLSLQQLDLNGSNEQLLQLPCECNGSASSFSGFSHLKKLRLQQITGCGRGWELLQCMMALESLQFFICKELTELPECLWSLRSLQSLQVYNCPIRMLPEWLGELQSLQELTIDYCKTLSSLPQSVVRLTSLQVLHIEHCDAFCELPEWLGDLRSLRRLDIEGFRGQACLPVSMCRLTSLEHLSIASCPGIKSLPEWIKGLTALRELRIFRCPDLVRRCERGKGEDWHLISHIPRLSINR